MLVDFMGSNSCKLISLALCACRIKATDFAQIFNRIGSSQTLLEFYGDANEVPTDVLEEFSQSITSDCPLQVLSLCGCEILGNGSEALATIIRKAKKLQDLRLDSNLIHETGAKEIANALPSSFLQSLSIADNQIWKDGTSEIISCTLHMKTFKSLDVSYNCVDLDYFAKYLPLSEGLQNLAISGCKVNQSLLPMFLNSLKSTKLQTLIMDGLNYAELPISWPTVHDVVFRDNELWDILHRTLTPNGTISDVRLGYLDLHQIFQIHETINRDLTLSIFDFCLTGNCWVFHFPDFVVESPVEELEVNTALTVESARALGWILENAFCNGQPVRTLVLNDPNNSANTLTTLIQSITRTRIECLDLGKNILSAGEHRLLIDFIRQHQLKSLKIDGCTFEEDGIRELFLTQNLENLKEHLSIGITGDHPFTEYGVKCKYIAEYLSHNPHLKSLSISGNISVPDMIEIVLGLRENTNLRRLGLHPSKLEEFLVPDPDKGIEDGDVEWMAKFCGEIERVLCSGNARSRLEVLDCPILSGVYIHADDIRYHWSKIEKRLEQNRSAIAD